MPPKLEGREAVAALGRGLAAAGIGQEQRALFAGRFSPRVAQALVAAGLDAPERLLFLKPVAFGALPGIGPAARKEIEAYRARFLVAAEL